MNQSVEYPPDVNAASLPSFVTAVSRVHLGVFLFCEFGWAGLLADMLVCVAIRFDPRIGRFVCFAIDSIDLYFILIFSFHLYIYFLVCLGWVHLSVTLRGADGTD